MKNLITLEGDHATFEVIKAGKVYQYTIDVESIPVVQTRRWSLKTRQGYLTCTMKGESVMLHHLIAGQPLKGWEIDHINRDVYDNRRANLRVVDHNMQMVNRRTYNRTGYRGVKEQGRFYYAQATYHRKKVYLGIYEAPEEAARAYDVWAYKTYGADATLNFPDRIHEAPPTPSNRGNQNGYRGIRKLKHGSYCAMIKGKYIGTYPTAIEAAMAYDSQARRFFPPGTKKLKLNFPDRAA